MNSLGSCVGKDRAMQLIREQFGQIASLLQCLRLRQAPIQIESLDSTIVKVHPNGTGAPKKEGFQAIGKSGGGCGIPGSM